MGVPSCFLLAKFNTYRHILNNKTDKIQDMKNKYIYTACNSNYLSMNETISS